MTGRTTPPPRRLAGGTLVVGIMLVLALAACGTDETARQPSTTAQPATTTTLDTTTTTAVPATSPPTTRVTTSTSSTTTTTATPTTTTAPRATTTTLDVYALASGSGCTPGTEELPDGQWYGFVESAGATEIEFDLACWFFGDAATLAAAEDGALSPPENSYYVRNDNPMLRTITVAGITTVDRLIGGSPGHETVSYTDWLAAPGPAGNGVWLTVENVVVVAIEEQYIP